MILFIYLILGFFAGLIAGAFGLGGGIIIVPSLILTFSYLHFPPEVLTHLAVGTSLSTIIFTSLSSIRVHHLKKAINYPLALKLSMGMVLGGLIGPYLASYCSGENLQKFFAIYALLIALKMWFSWTPKAIINLELPGTMGCGILGSIIGTVAGFFGIAGGALVVPALTIYKVPLVQAIATSAVTGFPIALSGAIGYFITGMNEPLLPIYSAGYIYLPAFIGIILTSTFSAKLGAKLAHQVSPLLLKKSFALILLLVAAKMFFI